MSSQARTMDSLSSPSEEDPNRKLAPSCERNKGPILDALKAILPSGEIKLLEIASGTGETPRSTKCLGECNIHHNFISLAGQHCSFFAAGCPTVEFQPTELEDDSFLSISSWCEGLPNVKPPILLDAASEASWAAVPGGPYDVIYAANIAHISPYSATQGLFAGASKTLRAGGGMLCIYGPFTTEGGKHSSEGNIKFDQSLREKNVEWGYRDIDTDLVPLGASCNLELRQRIEMPANNWLLIFSA